MGRKKLYKLFGREVTGYTIREHPNWIMIDVLQREGDCIGELPELERQMCPVNCGNVFVSLLYDTGERRIVSKGVVLVKMTQFVDGLKQHNLTLKQVVEMYHKKSEDLEYKSVRNGGIIHYKGTLVMGLLCDVGDEIDSTWRFEKEIKEYIGYISRNINKVLKKCGISIVEAGKLCVVFDEGEAKSIKDIELEDKIRRSGSGEDIVRI